jgi:hypothetical protein
MLLDILRNAPNIRFLSLLEPPTPWGRRYSLPLAEPPIVLPLLEVLYFDFKEPITIFSMLKWQLPNLTTLILSSFDSQSHDHVKRLFMSFGANLEVVEIQDEERDGSPSIIPFILEYCPRLVVLNFSIHLAHASLTDLSHSHLQSVGLMYHRLTPGSDGWLHHILRLLCNPSNLPALEGIVLYGDWSRIVYCKEFYALTEMVRSRNSSLSFKGRSII